MNANHIRKVRAMLAKAGLSPHKEDIVLSHTEGRTTSLTEMDYDETLSIIAYLEKQLGVPASPAEKMRNKIISIGHEMKWHRPGTRKIDMDRVNDWCVNKFKAPLDDLAYLDLCAAVTAFERVHVSYLRGI
jgi:hypothetical protein